jgi:hypothetical protein
MAPKMNTMELIKRRWDKLRGTYQNHGLVLALGAGISKGCKLPNWEELLRRLLAEKHPRYTGGKLFDKLKADGYSLPAIASMLETTYKKGEFPRAIWEKLYENFEFRKGIKGKNKERFVESVKVDNKTLATIAGLCACKDLDGSYLPNPRIHAIVNFNYDSILRDYVDARYNNGDILRSVERPSASSVYGAIPVYYMHGFFPVDKDIEDTKHGTPDLRVFTEQEYFDFYNNPHGLFNYTFLYLLREHPCLFVGLSMKDDNIRRLLHYSKSERVKGFIQGGREKRAESGSLRHYAILPYAKNKRVRDLTETSLERLGTVVLWIKEFGEIPEELGKIYDSIEPHDLSRSKSVADIKMSSISKWKDVF